MSNYKTDQENFWAGEFGDDYIDRNKSDQLLASNLDYFSKSLKLASKIDTVIEFGANIGMNLKALSLLRPGIKLSGVEINKDAAKILEELIGEENTYLDAEMNETNNISHVAEDFNEGGIDD